MRALNPRSWRSYNPVQISSNDATTKSVYFHLRRISRVRRRFNQHVTETLVNSLVTSRLDYCNSLMCLLPKTTLKKLQVAQNSAARTIMLARKRDHITPLLKELHWLPVHFRSQFKVLILAFKVLHGIGPGNINNLLSWYSPPRNLRSANQRFLARSSRPKNKFGNRAFMNAAVSLWNELPSTSALHGTKTLTEFRSKLKTHFFVLYFGTN